MATETLPLMQVEYLEIEEIDMDASISPEYDIMFRREQLDILILNLDQVINERKEIVSQFNKEFDSYLK